MPLSRNHRADLPEAIRDLSAMLTYERGGLGRSYWSAPRYVSAYLRIFGRGILCGCPASCRVWICPSPFATPKSPVTIADLGSGAADPAYCFVAVPVPTGGLCR